MEVKFSIRYKILLVVTSLLVSALVSQALIAARVFERDKTELVFDLNKSIVSTFAAEIQTAFAGACDKLKLFALFFEDHQGNMESRFSEVLESDDSMVYSSIIVNGEKKLEVIQKQILD